MIYGFTKIGCRWFMSIMNLEAALLVTSFILLCLTSTIIEGQDWCIKNPADVYPKRQVLGQDSKETSTLEIQSTEDRTSLLIAQVAKFFFSEQLGYEHIKIKKIENVSSTLDIFESFREKKFMINLEVPVTMNFILGGLSKYALKDCGNIAQPRKYSWLVYGNPATDTRIYEYNWTYFQKPDNLISFDLLNSMKYTDGKQYLAIQNFIRALAIDKPIECMNRDDCNMHGLYIPRWCKNTSCAVIFAPYPETRFIISDINELNLYIKVVFTKNLSHDIEENLSINLKGTNSSFLFVNFLSNSSDISMADSKPRVVSLPDCNFNENGKSSMGCKYQLTRLAKITTLEVDKLAKPVYSAVLNINFIKSDYEYLLTEYARSLETNTNESAAIFNAACGWTKRNEDTWRKWKKGVVNETIFIGGLFPRDSRLGYGAAMSAKMAIRALELNKSILPYYKLELNNQNEGSCRAVDVIKEFLKFVDREKNGHEYFIGILGPSCPEGTETLSVSSERNSIVVSYSNTGSNDIVTNESPLIRIAGNDRQNKLVYLEFLKNMEWIHIAALYEDGQKDTEYLGYMKDYLVENNVKFSLNAFPIKREKSSFIDYLKDLKESGVRVIIAQVRAQLMPQLICDAHSLRMTQLEGFVWFFPPWLELFLNLNCTEKDAREVLLGHFVLEPQTLAPDDHITHQNITVGQWKQSYRSWARLAGNIAPHAGYAYDAVWAYALATHKLLEWDPFALATLHKPRVQKKFLTIMKNLNFSGVSGHINLKSGNIRYLPVHLKQWQNTSNSYHTVWYFEPKLISNISEDDGITLLFNVYKNKSIVWYTKDGKKPIDYIEKCSFQWFADILNTSCNYATIIFYVSIIGCILIFVVIILLYIKCRYDGLQKTQALCIMKKISEVQNAKMKLSDKEIPRDCVISNRILGQGAFGTVYGGDFRDGTKLRAVAIKTLKNEGDVVDFLAEAEAMKLFDHKNLVKLLGVCITGDGPLSIVMEFMLFGDLKKFLLERRYLVYGQYNVQDSSDVSNKRLTDMAIDVAHGLSYLAHLNYVHRDVAARNCLINEHLVVKLGDFGLTRSMADSDYYRLCRQGHMPIRWMAPESLTIGEFSPASDVWSYGVLLYEMLTFGTKPFIGLAESQVVEKVKAGETLILPPGVPTKLEALIKSCFNFEPKKRPRISDIAEFLVSNSPLLIPCLKGPAPTVDSQVCLYGTSFVEKSFPWLSQTNQKVLTAIHKKSETTSSDVKTSLFKSASAYSFEDEVIEMVNESNNYIGNRNCIDNSNDRNFMNGRISLDVDLSESTRLNIYQSVSESVTGLIYKSVDLPLAENRTKDNSFSKGINMNDYLEPKYKQCNKGKSITNPTYFFKNYLTNKRESNSNDCIECGAKTSEGCEIACPFL